MNLFLIMAGKLMSSDVIKKLRKKDLDKVNKYLKHIGLSSYTNLSEDDINIILKTQFSKVYQYFMFILRNGKVIYCNHKDYDLIRSYKRFHKMTKWRYDNIDLDRKYVTEGFIQPVLYELVLAKRYNSDVDTRRILTDEYGRPYKEELIKGSFLPLARRKYLFEEFFTLYPYDRRHIRFSCCNLYYSYVLKNIDNDEVIKSIYTYNNFVIIHHDFESDFENINNIDIVTCKNIYDAKRLHDKFREFAYKRMGLSNPLKIIFWGEAKLQHRDILRDMIRKKTKWNDRKIISKSTKTSPI